MPEQATNYVRANYDAFQRQLPRLIEAHRGQFALLRDGEIVEMYDTPRDAYLVGQQLYADGKFSVQEIVDTPIDLGFYSHAVPEG